MAKKTKLPKAFRSKEHNKMRDNSAVPTDDYVVAVTDSEYKANSKKNGHFLALNFKVQSGEYNGHQFYRVLNLDNPSDTAVSIAEEEFATICDAAGKGVVEDSKVLHGVKMTAKVILIPEGDGKPATNDIVMYEPLGGGKTKAGFDDDEDEEDDETEKEETKSGDEEDDEVSVDEVKELARKYKKLTNAKKLKIALEEYDVEKVTGIDKMDGDDLESLKEDLEELIEDEE